MTIALVLGGLAAVALLMLLTGNATRAVVAAGKAQVASVIAESGSYTTYLPPAARWYDPGCISPFWIRISYQRSRLWELGLV